MSYRFMVQRPSNHAETIDRYGGVREELKDPGVADNGEHCRAVVPAFEQLSGQVHIVGKAHADEGLET